MYGTLANNSHILYLLRNHLIDIRPFDVTKLKTAHYPLTPYGVRNRGADGEWHTIHSFERTSKPHVFEANQYLVVDVNEEIIVEAGVIAKFVPTSNLIEQGFAITAGRLEHPFGQKGETLKFGMRNQLDSRNPLSASDYIAYVEFYDLRALRNRPTHLTPRDEKIFAARVDPDRKRRAEDGSVFSAREEYEWEEEES
jgi:hypothetical protein